MSLEGISPEMVERFDKMSSAAAGHELIHALRNGEFQKELFERLGLLKGLFEKYGGKHKLVEVWNDQLEGFEEHVNSFMHECFRLTPKITEALDKEIASADIEDPEVQVPETD